jgi:hypothetical protein
MAIQNRKLTLLKYFGLTWCWLSVAIVIISNVIIIQGWRPIIVGLLPFNVRDGVDTALLMAPGPIALIAYWLLAKK